MIKPVLCVCVFVCHPNVCESPGPKIEKEALNEWHRWTFLPSASASSCPRCHGPPFKAGPFEYWRDNPPLSIMKLPSEGVHSLSVHLSRSPPPLPPPHAHSVFFSIMESFHYMQVSGRLCYRYSFVSWRFWECALGFFLSCKNLCFVCKHQGVKSFSFKLQSKVEQSRALQCFHGTKITWPTKYFEARELKSTKWIKTGVRDNFMGEWTADIWVFKRVKVSMEYATSSHTVAKMSKAFHKLCTGV